jgi:hypothetical protein
LIDKSLWAESEIKIFETYKYMCVRCHRPAVVLHEIEPKSIRPKTWMDADNRVPLCAGCHEWVHRNSAKATAEYLRECAKKVKEYVSE